MTMLTIPGSANKTRVVYAVYNIKFHPPKSRNKRDSELAAKPANIL